MILNVVKYGDPVLRKKGARVESITAEIKKLAADMLETMHAQKGLGLAAQQIGQPLQLTVLDVPEIKDRPSWLEVGGERVPLKDFMPAVLVNPDIAPSGAMVRGGEGCLSFPEIYGEIERHEIVEVTAKNEKGKEIRFRCGGLLARAVQHEVDHLNGILFIDRMDKKTRDELRPELEALQMDTKAELQAAQKRRG